MTKTEVTRLPDHEGLANDYGDLVKPDQCRDGIMAIRGRIKHSVWAVAQIVLIAHSPTGGPLRILAVARPNDKAEWVVTTEINTTGSKTTIRELFDIATDITGQAMFLRSEGK